MTTDNRQQTTSGASLCFADNGQQTTDNRQRIKIEKLCLIGI